MALAGEIAGTVTALLRRFLTFIFGGEKRFLTPFHQKESSKDEALEKAPGLRPVSIVGALGAASRVFDKLAALALDPAPSARRW